MLFSKKLLFFQNQFPKLFTTPGAHTAIIPPGTYEVYVRSGGGAGGQNGANWSSYAGGAGGAGGQGYTASAVWTINEFVTVSIVVGEGGVVYAQGGNGGAPNTQVGGGAGGGGGRPSYISYLTVINGTQTRVCCGTHGGGGGGGGGGAGEGGRYGAGGAGGAGGGFYLFDAGTLTTTSYVGRNATSRGGDASPQNGVAGYTSLFSADNIRSGAGTIGSHNTFYGAGASGVGASGGSGNGGNNNSGAWGGGGGGGAPGSNNAGGGAGGRWGSGGPAGYGSAGSNHFTTPQDVNTWNTSVGAPGDWGKGGGTNQNGQSGFVLIKRV